MATDTTKFDPNAYLESVDTTGFDPDAYIAQASKKKPSYLQNLKKYYTEDIPGAIKTLGSQAKEQMYSNVVQPTETANALGLKKPGLIESVVAAPERSVRFTLGTLGTGADVIGGGINLAMQAGNRLGGGIPGQVAQAATGAYMNSGMAKGLESIGGKFAKTGVGKSLYNYMNPEDPAAKANIEATLSGVKGLTTFVGGPKAIKTTGQAVEDVSAAVEKKAAESYAKGLDISAKVRKKAYGSTELEKQQHLVNVIRDYDLPAISYKGSTQKIQNILNEARNESDEILTKLSTGKDAPRVIPTNIVSEAREFALKDVKYGKRDQADKMITKIIKDMEEDGLNKPVTLDKMIAAKKFIEPDFAKGASITTDDALENQIRKAMYFKVLDKMEQYSPRFRELGRKQKDMYDIKQAYEEALVKKGKTDKSFKSAALNLAAGGAGVGGYAATHNPMGAFAAAIPLALSYGTSEGRMPYMFMKAAKTGKTLGQIMKQGVK